MGLELGYRTLTSITIMNNKNISNSHMNVSVFMYFKSKKIIEQLD